tara:strand:+ start:263 stop:490 length:228 start_codon:yes stop_codon:yes gene_type:complete
MEHRGAMVETPPLILILQLVAVVVVLRVMEEILRVGDNPAGLVVLGVAVVQHLKPEDQEMLVVIVPWRVMLEEPL